MAKKEFKIPSLNEFKQPGSTEGVVEQFISKETLSAGENKQETTAPALELTPITEEEGARLDFQKSVTSSKLVIDPKVKTETKTKRVQIVLKQSQYEKLKKFAKHNKLSVNGVICALIDNCL